MDVIEEKKRILGEWKKDRILLDDIVNDSYDKRLDRLDLAGIEEIFVEELILIENGLRPAFSLEQKYKLLRKTGNKVIDFMYSHDYTKVREAAPKIRQLESKLYTKIAAAVGKLSEIFNKASERREPDYASLLYSILSKGVSLPENPRYKRLANKEIENYAALLKGKLDKEIRQNIDYIKSCINEMDSMDLNSLEDAKRLHEIKGGHYFDPGKYDSLKKPLLKDIVFRELIPEYQKQAESFNSLLEEKLKIADEIGERERLRKAEIEEKQRIENARRALEKINSLKSRYNSIDKAYEKVLGDVDKALEQIPVQQNELTDVLKEYKALAGHGLEEGRELLVRMKDILGDYKNLKDKKTNIVDETNKLKQHYNTQDIDELRKLNLDPSKYNEEKHPYLEQVIGDYKEAVGGLQKHIGEVEEETKKKEEIVKRELMKKKKTTDGRFFDLSGYVEQLGSLRDSRYCMLEELVQNFNNEEDIIVWFEKLKGMIDALHHAGSSEELEYMGNIRKGITKFIRTYYPNYLNKEGSPAKQALEAFDNYQKNSEMFACIN